MSLFVGVGACKTSRDTSGLESLSDSIAIVNNNDGTYTVTCKDHKVEVVPVDKIVSNSVCASSGGVCLSDDAVCAGKLVLSALFQPGGAP